MSHVPRAMELAMMFAWVTAAVCVLLQTVTQFQETIALVIALGDRAMEPATEDVSHACQTAKNT